VDPETPIGEGTLEGAEVDLLLLLALHGVVEQHPGLQDVKLAFGEEAEAREERRARVLERIRQEEAEDEATDDGEAAHDRKQPEPTSLSANTAHVQDAESQQLR